MEVIQQTERKTYRVDIIEITEIRKPELKTIYIDQGGVEKDHNELTYEERQACKVRRVASGGMDIKTENRTIFSQTFDTLAVKEVGAFLNT